MRNVPKSMSQLLRLTRFCAMSYYLDIKLISNERYMILFHGLWIINLGNTLKMYSDDFYVILMKAYEKYLAAQEHLWMNLELILIFCIFQESLFIVWEWLTVPGTYFHPQQEEEATYCAFFDTFIFLLFFFVVQLHNTFNIALKIANVIMTGAIYLLSEIS